MDLTRYFEVSHAADPDTLKRLLVGCAEDWGFGLMTAALVIEDASENAKFHMLSNMSAAWAAMSIEPGLGKRDPVNQRLRTSSLPFVYDQSTYVEADATDLWEIQAQYGYRAGVASAVHLGGGRHFLLGIDGDEPLPAGSGQLARLLADMQLLTVHAQFAATELLAPPKVSLGPEFKLSKRELEVLKWSSGGLTVAQIGDRIHVSPDTVKFHIKNICQKLQPLEPGGVRNRMHAVLIAQRAGLLD